jgi:hypothetical protein
VAGIGCPCEWDQEGEGQGGSARTLLSQKVLFKFQREKVRFQPLRELHTGLGTGPMTLTYARQHYPNTETGQNIGEN